MSPASQMSPIHVSPSLVIHLFPSLAAVPDVFSSYWSSSLADCVRLFRWFSLFVFHPGWWFGWWDFFSRQITVGVPNSFLRGVRFFSGGGVRLSGCLHFTCLPIWQFICLPVWLVVSGSRDVYFRLSSLICLPVRLVAPGAPYFFWFSLFMFQCA